MKQAAGHQPIRPGQQSEERQAGDDEDEARDRTLCLVRQRVGDEARGSPECDENNGEAGDEREARKRDASPDARVTQPLGIDGRDCRQVAGHERQHARERDRREAGQKEQPCLLHQAS